VSRSSSLPMTANGSEAALESPPNNEAAASTELMTGQEEMEEEGGGACAVRGTTSVGRSKRLELLRNDVYQSLLNSPKA